MAKILYSLKLTLFQQQLHNSFSEGFLKKVSLLSLFLCLYYIVPWLSASVGPDAPKNDLELLKDLSYVISKPSLFPEHFHEFASAGRNKLMDHLWYISERLVPFCLFSEKVNTQEKQKVRQAILRYTTDGQSAVDTTFNMSMPDFDPAKSATYQLHDFVGLDSWTFLKLVSTNYIASSDASTSQDSDDNPLNFLNAHLSKWENMPSYVFIKKQVRNLTVVNDVAERGLALITEFHSSKTPKSEEQKQYLYKVIKEMRYIQSKNSEGSERVTKRSLSKTLYDWSD